MTARIFCVDVGQGDCTVAVDESGAGIIIDCRGGHHKSAVAELDSLGLSELRAAVASHSHMDHFGGLLDVIETLDDRFTGRLYFNHDSLAATPVAGPDRGANGKKLRALLNRAREFGERLEAATPAFSPGSIGTMSVEFLSPTHYELVTAVSAGNPNLGSTVVLIQVGKDSIVIGADAPIAIWDRIAPSLPTGAVVRWPHHGGWIGSIDAHSRLMQILQPIAIVVSVGAGNLHGQPSAELFAAARSGPARLLCSQATPACVVGGGVGGKCAGTVRIYASGTGQPSVTTEIVDHVARILSFGNGQCL